MTKAKQQSKINLRHCKHINTCDCIIIHKLSQHQSHDFHRHTSTAYPEQVGISQKYLNFFELSLGYRVSTFSIATMKRFEFSLQYQALGYPPQHFLFLAYLPIAAVNELDPCRSVQRKKVIKSFVSFFDNRQQL